MEELLGIHHKQIDRAQVRKPSHTFGVPASRHTRIDSAHPRAALPLLGRSEGRKPTMMVKQVPSRVRPKSRGSSGRTTVVGVGVLRSITGT
eukprot:2122944-Prymnesium_polylepis.1